MTKSPLFHPRHGHPGMDVAAVWLGRVAAAIPGCERMHAEAVRMLSEGRTKKSKSGEKRPKRRNAPEEFKGLCRDCKERLTCTVPKPVGGIWHCEEYR
jgi:hypothetical protein